MVDYDALVNVLTTDKNYRLQMLADPEGTLRSAGIEATPEMIEALKGVDEETLQELAGDFFNSDCAITKVPDSQ